MSKGRVFSVMISALRSTCLFIEKILDFCRNKPNADIKQVNNDPQDFDFGIVIISQDWTN